MAEAAERLVEGSGWLPPLLRTVPAAADAEHVDPVEADGAEGGGGEGTPIRSRLNNRLERAARFGARSFSRAASCSACALAMGGGESFRRPARATVSGASRPPSKWNEREGGGACAAALGQVPDP